MKSAFYLILTFFFIGPLALFSQESYLRHYSTNDGLPSSETYSAFQDSKGYIWIASDMGVSRFDGYNFQVFNTSNGLTDNTIFKFYEDHAGRIWFYTFSGKLCYYWQDSIYGKNFSVNNEIKTFLGAGSLSSLYVDNNDTITLGTSKGLLKIMPGYLNKERCWNKIQIVNKKYSLITSKGYISLEAVTNDSTLLTKFERNKIPVHVKLYGHPANFNNMLECKNGTIMLSYGKITYQIDSAGTTKEYKVLQNVICGFQENDSVFWFGHKHSQVCGGVFCFSIKDTIDITKAMLNQFSVTGILKDREGAYWFTTLEEGLFYLSSNKFTYFNSMPGPLKWPESSIHSVKPNEVILLSRNKVYKLLYPSGTIDHIRTFEDFAKGEVRLLNAHKSSDGQVWLSSNSAIYILDSTLKKTVYQLTMLEDCPKCIQRDSRQILDENGETILSLNQNSVTEIDRKTKKERKTFIIPSRADAACLDNAGNPLVATLNGLYNIVNDSLVYLGNKDPVFKNRFVELVNCKRKILGASRGAGVIIIDDDSIYRISTADGLLSNLCRSICVDENGTIWVATNKGLNSIRLDYNPFRISIKSLTTIDGLLSNDNYQVIQNGKIIWLLSPKGITAFSPDESIYNYVPPPVHITKAILDGQPINTDLVRSFNYGFNFLEIQFVGLTYKNAGKQLYKYKLEGYDTTTHFINTTAVQFSKLPAGEYRFVVSCVNNSGKESDNPAVFTFYIKAPFYQKWWFGVCVCVFVILLSVIVSGIILQRLRKNEFRKTELNKKIANMELRALRAQMNPHFIFNCLNAIQDFITKNDTTSAKKYLTDFSKLIRNTLDNSRKQNILLDEEIQFLNLYIGLEKMRYSDGFEYHIMVDKNVQSSNIEVPSMIFQPFVENSIRHGRIGTLDRKGELKISFHQHNNVLECQIDDNGIGYYQSLQSKSSYDNINTTHALHIIDERMRTIKQISQSDIRYTIIDKSNDSNHSTGTLVTIYIYPDNIS